MQSLGKIEQRAPAVGAKIWCLYVYFLNCLSIVRRLAVRSRGHNLPNYYCVMVYGPILILFSQFFSEVIPLSEALESFYFRR